MSELGSDSAAKPLSGIERAALVLRELGEEVAATVLRHLDENTIHRLSAEMAFSRKIPASVREQVMNEFAQNVGAGGDGGDGYKFTSKVLVNALGESRAREIISRLQRGGRSSPFQLSINADPRTLAMQMANERPQTLALLLTQLPHETGAAMLSYLPEKLVAEAVYRFTTLDAVSPDTVSELLKMTAELVADSDNGGRRLANLGGAKRTADILNHLQSSVSDRVMEAIEWRDSVAAAQIRENLFTFLDLIKLSDRALQILLREVPSQLLAPALRVADDSIRQHFFRNMSSRTVELLNEELQSGPPIRRADALTAQSEVVEIALRLGAEGRISINASEDLV